MAVVWTEPSLLDMVDIADFYSLIADDETADRMIDALRQDIEKLSVRPMLRRKDHRLSSEKQQYEFWFALDKRYRVYFHRLDLTSIEVYRVWSTRRIALKPEDIVPKQA